MKYLFPALLVLLGTTLMPNIAAAETQILLNCEVRRATNGD